MSVSLGPLALPLDTLLLLVTALIFIESAKFLARRAPGNIAQQRSALAGKGAYIAIFSALLIARTAFVVRFWQQYSASPLQIINIRDGGFSAQAGWFAFAALLLFYSYRHKHLLRMYALSAAIALSVMIPANIAMTLYKQGKGLPGAPVASLSGEQVSLHNFTGKPMVVNYWASWCPPCRREMPVLEAAQRDNSHVNFVFVNQGETASTVRTYLQRNKLTIDNVLLDRARNLSQASGAAGLPTTLFFDETGQLQDMHMGEISEAGLRSYLDKL